jgi:hypothetical protein
MSGHCLYLLFECEQGHKWEVRFEDHSAGIWISAHNVTEPEPDSQFGIRRWSSNSKMASGTAGKEKIYKRDCM